MRISEAWQLYEQDKRLLGYSSFTLRAYSLQANLLSRELQNVPITEISYQDLKLYLSKQTHLKPASLGHRVRFLKSFFRWALDEGYINQNPASKLREPKIPQRIPKNLTEEVLELLREGCLSSLEHVLVELLFSTGARIGEIYRANKSDIDWHNRSLRVIGKGNKEREVYYSVKCDIWLKRYINSRKDNDEALIVTERKPHRMSIAEIRYIIKRVAKRAGIRENVYPRRLRHSLAVHLLNNGMPIEVIQSLLGHAKTETTLLYTMLSGEKRREMYRRYF